MSHPLVIQLRFTRSELVRALDGLSDIDARRRLVPMNSISWILGHLAFVEQKIWLTSLQGQTPRPHLNDLYGSDQPVSTPPLAEMREAWQTITQMTEPLLETLTTTLLQLSHAELVNVLRCEQVWPSNISTRTKVPGKGAPYLVYFFWNV